MNFKEALEYLGISDYSERIINSNSRGELFHLSDYVAIAEHIKKSAVDSPDGWFREWFETVVETAQKQWQRPESIFQHIVEIWNTQATSGGK